MLLTFQALGIPLSQGKTIDPNQVLEFLGIELESNTVEVTTRQSRKGEEGAQRMVE